MQKQFLPPPPLPTRFSHLEETRHGFVRAPDLDLEEGSLVPVAALGGALLLGLLRVVPGARSAEDVLALTPDVVAPRVDGAVYGVLVGAGAALEPVASRLDGRDGKDVGAVRAD